MRLKEQDMMNHLLGMYIQSAISSCFGGKYVQEQFLATVDMTPEEILKQKQLEFAMKEDKEYINWCLTHNNNEDNGGTE